jgi:hypothetical protein
MTQTCSRKREHPKLKAREEEERSGLSLTLPVLSISFNIIELTAGEEHNFTISPPFCSIPGVFLAQIAKFSKFGTTIATRVALVESPYTKI